MYKVMLEGTIVSHFILRFNYDSLHLQLILGGKSGKVSFQTLDKLK